MIEGAEERRDPDRSLVRLLGQAQNFHDMVAQNTDMSLAELAEVAGITRSYFTRVFRLSFLAPLITTAILEGSQPPELTANKLKQMGTLNQLWSDQLSQLGFLEAPVSPAYGNK
ncbi:helix-turn-helix transcriptional regulator [Hyphomicrobium sp. 802]|uniref:helix-turn-helix transcriptional regulator n=1 Tax=Hyphomicrobium sp. 802 TaxID=1112272 RepID=UPI001FD91422|nr:helix-turn-helix transcriptional regulator [Hyphomicrobium sp. 802]